MEGTPITKPRMDLQSPWRPIEISLVLLKGGHGMRKGCGCGSGHWLRDTRCSAAPSGMTPTHAGEGQPVRKLLRHRCPDKALIATVINPSLLSNKESDNAASLQARLKATLLHCIPQKYSTDVGISYRVDRLDWSQLNNPLVILRKQKLKRIARYGVKDLEFYSWRSWRLSPLFISCTY